MSAIRASAIATHEYAAGASIEADERFAVFPPPLHIFFPHSRPYCL